MEQEGLSTSVSTGMPSLECDCLRLGSVDCNARLISWCSIPLPKGGSGRNVTGYYLFLINKFNIAIPSVYYMYPIDNHVQ